MHFANDKNVLYFRFVQFCYFFAFFAQCKIQVAKIFSLIFIIRIVEKSTTHIVFYMWQQRWRLNMRTVHVCVCVNSARDAVNGHRQNFAIITTQSTLIIDLWTFLRKRHFEHISICMTSHCNAKYAYVFILSVRVCAMCEYGDSDDDGVSANAYACSHVQFFALASLPFFSALHCSHIKSMYILLKFKIYRWCFSFEYNRVVALFTFYMS